jgi:hypothetical protein
MRVRDDEGCERNATFQVHIIDETPTIIFESRGGTKGTPSERNSEYALGLEIVLARLKIVRATITDIVIETARTKTLPAAKRQLLVEGHHYPLVLEEEMDIPRFRQHLSAAQSRVGHAVGAKGGNPTRRIRIELMQPMDIAPSDLESFLSTGNRGIRSEERTGHDVVSTALATIDAISPTPIERQEGRRRLEMHFAIERATGIVREAKRQWRNADSNLPCECCGFSFVHAVGVDYVEAHHRVPLANLRPNEVCHTRVEDLARVCANCHRILHLRTDFTVDQLRNMWATR